MTSQATPEEPAERAPSAATKPQVARDVRGGDGARPAPAGTPAGTPASAASSAAADAAVERPLHIFDTTLRDGAQREGINLSVADKLTIARHLD
ncbi:hypothetical protein ADL27_29495, partial [Streptomyces sp. NRRL F-6602]